MCVCVVRLETKVVKFENYTCTPARARAQTHTHTHTHIHTHTQTLTNKCARTHARTRTHANTYNAAVCRIFASATFNMMVCLKCLCVRLRACVGALYLFVYTCLQTGMHACTPTHASKHVSAHTTYILPDNRQLDVCLTTTIILVCVRVHFSERFWAT